MSINQTEDIALRSSQHTQEHSAARWLRFASAPPLPFPAVQALLLPLVVVLVRCNVAPVPCAVRMGLRAPVLLLVLRWSVVLLMRRWPLVVGVLLLCPGACSVLLMVLMLLVLLLGVVPAGRLRLLRVGVAGVLRLLHPLRWCHGRRLQYNADRCAWLLCNSWRLHNTRLQHQHLGRLQHDRLPNNGCMLHGRHSSPLLTARCCGLGCQLLQLCQQLLRPWVSALAQHFVQSRQHRRLCPQHRCQLLWMLQQLLQVRGRVSSCCRRATGS